MASGNNSASRQRMRGRLSVPFPICWLDVAECEVTISGVMEFFMVLFAYEVGIL